MHALLCWPTVDAARLGASKYNLRKRIFLLETQIEQLGFIFKLVLIDIGRAPLWVFCFEHMGLHRRVLLKFRIAEISHI